MGTCCSGGVSDGDAPRTAGSSSRSTELSTIHPPSGSSQGAPRPESRAAPRPASSRQRPGAESRPPSARPHRQGSCAELRSSSRSGRPRRQGSGAESRPSSQSGRPHRGGPRPHSKGKASRPSSSYGPSSTKRAPYSTIHEDPVDDRTILASFSTLSTLALHHAASYYHSDVIRTGSALSHDSLLDDPGSREARIRQLLVQTIIDARSARDVTNTVLNSLIARLEPYAFEPQSQDRQDHLRQICTEGAALKRHIQPNPPSWQFGSWDAPEGSMVVFPSVHRNVDEVRPTEVVELR